MKKGFTTVELIASFALISTIILFLFQIIFALRDLYIESGIKVKLLTKQGNISYVINNDLTVRELRMVTKESKNSIKFYFRDGTNKILSYDRDSLTITYGDNTYELVSGSKIGNVSIKTDTAVYTEDSNTLNGILAIDIPITHSLIKQENFGINLTYLYNSNSVSVAGLNIIDVVNSPKKIILDNDKIVTYQGSNFTNPGYYVYTRDTKEMSQNDPNVEITGRVDTSKIGNYYLTYTLRDEDENMLDQVVCSVKVIKSTYEFTYSGNTQEFTTPVSGIYKIELWGAEGGGISSMTGKGGYTTGQIELRENTVLFVNVGGKGTISTNYAASNGGFNGGGKSGSPSIVGSTNSTETNMKAGSGGGATDLRLTNNNLSSRIAVAGGGGGAGSKNDSVFVYVGGAGGGIAGKPALSAAESYVGGVGTQASGGAKPSYTTNMTTMPTAGTSLNGGNGGTYQSGNVIYATGGGGGGYYGGAGGSRYAGGSGGSGYCGDTITNCNLIDGTSAVPLTTGSDYETGHTGNGFVRLTLVSYTEERSEEMYGLTYEPKANNETHSGTVYMDPTDLTNNCNSTNYSTSPSAASGCMRFYVIKDNGNTLDLILDHSITNETTLSGNHYVLPKLDAWDNVFTRKDSYNGYNYAGSKFRLITVKELAQITKKSSTATTVFTFDTAGSSTVPNKYAWLFGNLKGCSSYGCGLNHESSITSYITADNTADSTYVVDYMGSVSLRNNTTGSGITSFRPVVTIPSSLVK